MENWQCNTKVYFPFFFFASADVGEKNIYSDSLFFQFLIIINFGPYIWLYRGTPNPHRLAF